MKSRGGHEYERYWDASIKNYRYVHREILESKLGRKLEKNEEVHHINGDKRDNRPENLEVQRIDLHARITFGFTKGE